MPIYYYALGQHAGIGDTIMGIAVSVLAWNTYYKTAKEGIS